MKLNTLLIGALCGLTLATQATASDGTTPVDPDGMPTLEERFATWSTQPFRFDGEIENMRRSTPDFSMTVGGRRYPIVFDAGRAKRNAMLDCLELSDTCDVKGTGFMVFEDRTMKLNVTDITWLSIPPVDFDEKATRIHRCVKNARGKQSAFSSVVLARLDVLDLDKAQAVELTPLEPREGGRGFELVRDAVHLCFGRYGRMRLPVGQYELKVYTQSAETFLKYSED